MTFFVRLRAATVKNNSLLCVGLDPEPSKLPAGLGLEEFLSSVIEVTRDLVCAYKPNAAFFEAMGEEGWRVLYRLRSIIPTDIPLVFDAKRGDVGNTAKAYARAAFDSLGADAVTVSPYLGFDSIEPFIEYRDRGVFILCRTSNAGSTDFQSLAVDGKRPLYEVVAERAASWNHYGNVGLVVGATQMSELRTIRTHHPAMPLLIPGLGVQGGDLANAVFYGTDSFKEGAIFNVSRAVLYASPGKDFAAAARAAAEAFRDSINCARRQTRPD